MSRSPQNGGFHRCTGGSPLPAGVALAASLAATVSPSRPWVPVCPCFAIVCPECRHLIWHDCCTYTEICVPDDLCPYYCGSSRHIVMPFIPRKADNVGI